MELVSSQVDRALFVASGRVLTHFVSIYPRRFIRVAVGVAEVHGVGPLGIAGDAQFEVGGRFHEGVTCLSTEYAPSQCESLQKRVSAQ